MCKGAYQTHKRSWAQAQEEETKTPNSKRKIKEKKIK